jgi:hypothetical protein
MSIALDTFVAVPISHQLFMRLASRWPGGITSGVEDVLHDFLERTQEDFQAAHGEAKGLQWDSVHLPHGTELRTRYYGETQIAAIDDGRIVWDGEEYPSISRLASAMRGDTSNNAWKVIEVKKPTDAKWTPAERLRR